MSTATDQLNYIKTKGLPEILSKFEGEKLKNYEIVEMTGLNGFMSAIYGLLVTTENLLTNKEKTYNIIVKFMKGDLNFRESSRSYTQFANEIFIYSKVLPYFEKIVKNSGITTVNVKEWVPHVYMAKYGQIDGLSVGTMASDESVLAMENLKPKGFQLARIGYWLDYDHLLLMAKLIGEYHSLTYLLRIQNDQKLEEFIKEIVPLPFVIGNKINESNLINNNNPNSEKDNNFYKVLYNAAFERFFKYYDKVKETLKVNDNKEDARFVDNVNRLRSKYGNNPIGLLERLRNIDNDEDERFFLILHGDFNRNNVLYKYGIVNSPDSPTQIKMIDFQELRYGSPALDLSFAFYMNTEADVREEIWMKLIEHYHATLLKTIRDILTATTDDAAAIEESLKLYSFDKFYRHFSKYAFYGVMVCMHFKPWLNCPNDELEKLSHWFETDLHSEEFYKISLEAGGDYADEKIFSVLRHASRHGYMDHI